MTRLSRIALLAALACAAAQPPLAASRPEWTKPTKKWIRGPVRCLATEEEEKQFKALKTDEEVARFIKEFWARRDPTPETPENEFEELFWKRAEEANKRFVQTTDSGAMSERGQIFILFGLPTRIAPPGKNVEWIYENLPYVNPPTFSVLFREVGAGNFLLLGKKEVESIIAANEFLRGLGAKAREIYAPSPPAVAEAPPPATESAPPPETAPTEEQRLLDAAVASETLPSALSLAVRTDVYEATQGDSFVAVTLGVPRSDAAGGGLVGFARFLPVSGEVQPVTLAASESFAPAQADGTDASNPHWLLQGGAGLHPGRYTLLAGVRDPASGKVGMTKQPLDVPALAGGGLTLSTVTLARKLERIPAPPAPGKKVPFILGSFRVIPSLDSVFPQGSRMAWYYQIYNAAADPATGKPNLTVEFTILLKQKGEYRGVIDPQIAKNRSSQVEAYSFPLLKPTPAQKGYVPGDYKLVIKVTDEVAKSTVSRELPFTVIP